MANPPSKNTQGLGPQPHRWPVARGLQALFPRAPRECEAQISALGLVQILFMSRIALRRKSLESACCLGLQLEQHLDIHRVAIVAAVFPIDCTDPNPVV